jgi:hypothetical protein
MRGGLGVRKRLSEESMRDTYRLNGVRTGSAIARCYDKYGRWEYGYTIGVLVRKNTSIVQIRWADTPEKIDQYSQGDARYEVDRGRWRILGVVQGNPLDPNNPIAVALTGLMGSGIMPSSSHDDTPTDRGDDEQMAEQSNAAAEREAAKKAVANGSLKDRDLYTAKQVATRCGTDPKTMRKFFRSKHSTVEAVGQGGRYEFDAKDLPRIKKEFDAWTARARQNSTRKPSSTKAELDKVADAIERSQEVEHEDPDEDEEPTEEDLAEVDDLELDLDDLDGEEVN